MQLKDQPPSLTVAHRELGAATEAPLAAQGARVAVRHKPRLRKASPPK